MKNLIITIVSVLTTGICFGQLLPKLSVCNLNVSELSISGEVSFENGQWDTSNACVTVSGSYDLCDSHGATFAMGFTFSSQSTGCRNAQKSTSVNNGKNLYFPVQLLGDVDVKEHNDIPFTFPNPSDSGFILKTNRPDLINKISVYSDKGILIKVPITINQDGYSIDLSNQKIGNYIITFTDDDFKFTQHLVKK